MDTEYPLVSIVVPCYNHEKYVTECLESIRNQDYENYELYIVNDGSSDNSAEVIYNYIEQYGEDERLHFCNYEENTCFGWHDEVIPLLQGKYYVFISADDMVMKERFIKQVEFLEDHSDRYKACFSWVTVIDSDGDIISQYEEAFQKKNASRLRKIKNLVTYTNHIAAPTMMMDMNVYRELGGYDFNSKQLQDYDLWLRFLIKYDFYIIPEKLTIYRALETSISNSGGVETVGRLNYELNDVLYNYVKDMPDDIFVKAFEYKDVSLDDHELIKFKKVKFFMDNGSEIYTDIAIRLLGEYIKDNTFCKYMKANGVIPRKLYHKLVGKHSVYTRMISYNVMLENLQKELSVSNAKIDELLNLLAEQGINVE